jgi:hypothetical protein
VGGGWLQFSVGGRWLGAVAPGREMTLIRGQVPDLSPNPAPHQ